MLFSPAAVSMRRIQQQHHQHLPFTLRTLAHKYTLLSTHIRITLYYIAADTKHFTHCQTDEGNELNPYVGNGRRRNEKRQLPLLYILVYHHHNMCGAAF